MTIRGKLWKIGIELLLTGMAICCLNGCGAVAAEEEGEGEETDQPVQIGITFDSFIIERWQRDRDVFVSAAQELGAEVNVQNANGDIDEQAAQIDYFIKKKMDVIVVIMVASDDNTGEFYNAVERAKKAGIPVVAYDRLILNSDVDLYISFDNVEVGRLMAEHMKEHLGSTGTLLQICGPLSDYNVPQVMSGFEEVLKESSIEIAETEYAQGWYAETGFSVTGNYLGSHKAPDGIMCGNDSIAGQAIRALSEHRLTGSVCVVGQDADLDACQRIVEGTQCMTVYKPVEKLARRAAELSVELAEGKALSVKETIDDGTYQVPYERLEPIAVTKENMDEVITGKYHEESDIYLNVRK
jgi:D-xylose transport system substrate-binding protein